jgi:hypothetical protein
MHIDHKLLETFSMQHGQEHQLKHTRVFNVLGYSTIRGCASCGRIHISCSGRTPSDRFEKRALINANEIETCTY